MRSFVSALLLVFSVCALAEIRAPATFNEAKKMAWPLYAIQSIEFYCGCQYKGNRVNLASCGYSPRKNRARAERIEWEHIVTAWAIGHQRQCWQKGGRQYCSKYDEQFRRAEADLHNLVPSIGEINGDRSNFSYAWLGQKPHQYGRCQMVVDFKARKVMPRQEVRGMIARTHFYMADRYKLRLSKQDRQLFEVWHKAYPPRAWETQRNQLVACRMGWGNPYIGKVDLSRCAALLGGL